MNPYQSPVTAAEPAKRSLWEVLALRLGGTLLLAIHPVVITRHVLLDGGSVEQAAMCFTSVVILELIAIAGAAGWLASFSKVGP